MPLYADRFSGHMPEGDPRTPVFAAGLCTWPTVPPWRFYFHAPNGSGNWSNLRVNGMLFEKWSVGTSHDYCIWWQVGTLGNWHDCSISKFTSPWSDEIAWDIWMVNDSAPLGIATKAISEPPGPCNTNHVFGRFGFANPRLGNAGDDSMIYQVEYDEGQPPGWFE